MPVSITYAAFHDASTTVVIPVKRHAVVADLVFLARDHHPNLVLPQPVADPSATVALVTGKRIWPCTGMTRRLWNANRVHHRLEPFRFVALTGTDLDRERQSRTVSNQVELAPESAARAAQCMICGLFRVAVETFLEAPAAARLARIELPSMHHKSQSMEPLASSRTCNASRIRSNTPSSRHRLK